METNIKRYSLPEVIKHYTEYSDKLQNPEKIIFEILKSDLNQMKMLDIGVGGGRTTIHFAPHVKEYIGIDFSAGMINACKERFKTTIPSAKFEVADVRNLSQFSTGYFDFVFFSFNGLDTISHEERGVALKEMKRICAPQGFFFFSSHNLQCLPDFFKIHFRLHLIKFFKNLIKRKELIANNKEQISKIPIANYLNIYDDVYDFGLHTYYIRPSYQVEQLKTIGFSSVQVFDLSDRKELIGSEQFKHAKDSWIYYLCR